LTFRQSLDQFGADPTDAGGEKPIWCGKRFADEKRD
jgi:hypothetical protein